MNLRQHFLRLIHLSDLDAQDGEAIGECAILAAASEIAERKKLLSNRNKVAHFGRSGTSLKSAEDGGNGSRRVSTGSGRRASSENIRRGSLSGGEFNVQELGADKVVSDSVALGELNSLYPWFCKLLAAILENRVWIDGQYSTDTALTNLTEKEASVLGHFLNFFMKSEQPVKSWIASISALTDLNNEFPWFEKMVSAIVKSFIGPLDGTKEANFSKRIKSSIAESSRYSLKTLRNTIMVAVLPTVAAILVFGPLVNQRASQYYGNDRELHPSVYRAVPFANTTVVPIFVSLPLPHSTLASLSCTLASPRY